MAYVHNPQKSVDSGFSTTSHTKTKSFLTKPTQAQTSYSQNDADIEEIQISSSPGFKCEAQTSDVLGDSVQNVRRYSVDSSRVDYEGVDTELYRGSISVSKSSFDSSMTNSSYTFSHPRTDTQNRGLFRSSFPDLKRLGKFDEKSLCSRDDNLKEDFDPYRALYAIKFDSFTSSIDLDSFLDELKPTKLKKNHRNSMTETHVKPRPVAKVLFYIGFLFFPAWVYGAFYLPAQVKTTGEDYTWRRRNRVTCIIFAIFSVASVMAFIIVDPKYFGFSAITR
ncbi:hypothetical protein K7432_008820 [Basidiobolus ranarum]|uniref:Uncharacterized protein n=1 Tax=Basidiobolus ranarum TaxID=34480 RepID=A0ABR2WR87_9FUNG